MKNYLGRTSDVLEPFEWPEAKTHLRWMRDYQASVLEKLYKEGKLKERLAEIAERAESEMYKMELRGISRDRALEIVTESILAPPRSNYRPMEYERFFEIEENLYSPYEIVPDEEEEDQD